MTALSRTEDVQMDMDTNMNKQYTVTNGSTTNHEQSVELNGIKKESIELTLEEQLTESADISFHNICYSIKTRSNCCKSAEKNVLKDVSGIFSIGMNAIVGATGSGKTSLLDIIAKRKDPQFLSGNVFINGCLQPKNFKCMSGYVVQEDIVMGTLTVRENLNFSAALRMPTHVCKVERLKKVQQVIEELGLTGVAESRIGTETLRGISGGEKKRTSIGMELVLSPKFLFLDEPTTGLDSSTAWSVMVLLQQLSKTRTIVFSIHQPRYSISKLFDTITLLSDGQLMFHGPATDILEHFTSLGYFCEVHNNPLDFIMDIICGSEQNSNQKSSLQGEDLTNYLVAAYKKSTIYKNSAVQLQQYETVNDNTKVKPEKVYYSTPISKELGVLITRNVKNAFRNPDIVSQLVMKIIMALITGMIYFQIIADLDSGVQNRVGVFFFVTMNMLFGNMSAVEAFHQNRQLFIHESSNGYYRILSFFISTILSDWFLHRIVPILVYAPICYFMVGLSLTAEQFFFFALTLMMVGIGGCSLCFFCSASFERCSLSKMLLALCFVFMMIFGGLLVNLEKMGAWISWVKYLSLFRYCANALSINELKNKQFCNSTTEPQICSFAGNQTPRNIL